MDLSSAKSDSEGLLPECSIGMKDQEQKQLKLKHAWQIASSLCNYDRQGRLLTEGTNNSHITADGDKSC